MMAAYAYSMLGAMLSSFSCIAFSNEANVSCARPGRIKISVEPHHTITRRSAPLSVLKRRMSSRICSASSRLFLPLFTFVPSNFFT